MSIIWQVLLTGWYFAAEELIMEFMSYLVILRIGLMGLTFSIYLRKVFGKEDPAALLFPLRMLCPAIWRPTTGM